MYYITVSNGLLDNKHRKRMGSAVWEFMWILDKMTKIDTEKGTGLVLGGKPIKSKEISEDLGVSSRTVRGNLNKLEDNGYIETTRTPYGSRIKVINAKKVFQKRAEKIRHL